MIFTKLFLTLVWAAMMGLTSSGVVKRSDDSDPYEAILNTHSQELTSLQARLQAMENRLAQRESFQAQMPSGPVPANAPIHFGAADVTVGGAHYDPTTGIYTVGTPGLYLVGFQLFPVGMADTLMDLYIGGTIRVRSRCFDSQGYSTSCASSAIFRLQAGNTLWMQTNRAGNYYTGPHSFFFATLLSPDP